MSVLIVVALLVGACADSSDEADAAADDAVSASAYFRALEEWSAELSTRMEEVDQGEPAGDDPGQHADFRQRRMDAWTGLEADLAQIEPSAETADAHLELLDGLRGVFDLEERLREALQSASSASEVFNSPLGAEREVVGGRVLGTCRELLEIARDLGIQVELFCGSTDE